MADSMTDAESVSLDWRFFNLSESGDSLSQSNSGSANDTSGEIELLYFALPGVIGIIICIFGFIGNLLNITVLSLTVRRNRTPTYHILLALAVADSMVMVIYGTFALTFFARQSPIIRPHHLPINASSFMVLTYNTWYMAINAFVCSSNWYVVAVTFFRFLAVYFPMKVAIWCTLKRVRVVIVAIFVLSVAIAIPDMLTVQLSYDDNGFMKFTDTALYSDPVFGRVYYTLQTVVLHLMPYTLNGILVSVLIRTLFTSHRDLKLSINVKNTKGRSLDQKRISVMLIVIVLFSLVTTLPSIVYRILRDFFGVRETNEDSSSLIMFRAACDVIELLNYASNFYLYIASNSSYRKRFIQTIKCEGNSMRHSFTTQYSMVSGDHTTRRPVAADSDKNANTSHGEAVGLCHVSRKHSTKNGDVEMGATEACDDSYFMDEAQ